MKTIGFLLLVVGVLGLLVSAMMFGDIGVAAAIGSIVGILSGIGFMNVPKAIRNAMDRVGKQ